MGEVVAMRDFGIHASASWRRTSMGRPRGSTKWALRVKLSKPSVLRVLLELPTLDHE